MLTGAPRAQQLVTAPTPLALHLAALQMSITYWPSLTFGLVTSLSAQHGFQNPRHLVRPPKESPSFFNSLLKYAM